MCCFASFDVIKALNGSGPEILDLTASPTPNSEHPAVIAVANELAAGKRGREEGELNPEAEAQEEEEQALRAEMDEEAERLRQLQLAPLPPIVPMEVEPLDGAGPAGGEQKKRIGMHGAMDWNGNALCQGYSEYSFNSRRVGGEDGWRRFEEVQPGGARDFGGLSMVWLVMLTFVYARRTCRLLGRCFASVHKARRKKLIGACGTRSAFGLVQLLVVLLLFVCWMGLCRRDGHCAGGDPGRAHPPDVCGGSTLAA